MDPLVITIISIFAIIIATVAVFGFAASKSRKLCIIVYESLFYYLQNYKSMNFYRDPTLSLLKTHREDYDTLVDNKDKWFVKAAHKKLIADAIQLYESSSRLTDTISPYFSLDHYFSKSESDNFSELFIEIPNLANKLHTTPCKAYLKLQYGELDENSELPKLEDLRANHNKEFVTKELKENKEYFDTLLKYPLDAQQRESVVKLEDNCLVISSAGSGKTSTSIAKVKYLIDKRGFQPGQILVLSYNRKTAEEFRKRLAIPEMTCKTFHALAMEILAQENGIRPDICEETFLFTCFYSLIKKSKKFKNAVVTFFSEKASLVKNMHDYTFGQYYYADRAKYGIMAPYGDMNGNPVYTKSEEERKICTWLSSHGVDFLYEQPYPHQEADSKHRQYKPDFTIYFKKNGKKHKVYLEHYGINEKGDVPRWFGDGVEGGFKAANKKYNEEIEWKKKLHKKHKTRLLFTTSAMFHDGSIYENLESLLLSEGIPCEELTTNEKYIKLIETNASFEENIKTLVSSFINLMKSNGLSFDDIYEKIKKSNEGRKWNFCERSHYLMYEIIKPLKEEYELQLKNNGQMDFTDLILKATELCDSKKFITPYDYIIVDEFQDISVDRYKFILSLRKTTPLTKTYCVGDDWQSIYRFSGSDMNLFNHFENYFGFTERCKIETTYRFGNPLIEISSDFILQNPAQVRKKVIPKSERVRSDISFVPFNRSENPNYLDTIEETLNEIPISHSVLLLARYNHEINVFPKKSIQQSPNSKRAIVRFADRTMNFMSVHAAKGLEADDVIILNCSQDAGGFPSKISDDPILGYVLSDIDNYDYSEERRLFYVAITRAKKHAYVLYNENMPSVFVTELLQQIYEDEDYYEEEEEEEEDNNEDEDEEDDDENDGFETVDLSFLLDEEDEEDEGNNDDADGEEDGFETVDLPDLFDDEDDEEDGFETIDLSDLLDDDDDEEEEEEKDEEDEDEEEVDDEDENVHIKPMICPRCKKGLLILRKKSIAKNGNPYHFYCCCNSVAGCNYTWLVFFDEGKNTKKQLKRKYKTICEANPSVVICRNPSSNPWEWPIHSKKMNPFSI